MLKKLIVVFVLIGLILPQTSWGVAGTYYACPRSHPFQAEGRCCEKVEKDKCLDKDGNPDPGVNRLQVCYEGFVPCGLGKPVWEEGVANSECGCPSAYPDCMKEKGVSCQFCHAFVMIDGIVEYFLIYIIPVLAILMIVIGGIMFYLGGTKPQLLNQAKKLLVGVIIGLFLVYGSYLIVGLFLNALGVADWTGLQEWASQGAFSITCDIY